MSPPRLQYAILFAFLESNAVKLGGQQGFKLVFATTPEASTGWPASSRPAPCVYLPHANVRNLNIGHVTVISACVCFYPSDNHNVLLDDFNLIKPRTVLLFHPSDVAAGLHPWFRQVPYHWSSLCFQQRCTSTKYGPSCAQGHQAGATGKIEADGRSSC